MVMIAAFQAVGPGSIPGCRIFYFLFFLFFFIRKILIDLRDKNENIYFSSYIDTKLNLYIIQKYYN